MKKQRITALILCALLTANYLIGCGGASGSTESPAQDAAPAESTETAPAPVEETEPEIERLTYDTTGLNYEGYEFHIWNFDNIMSNGWSRADIPDDMISAELNGDMLNDAVYNRNKKVESELNIVLKSEDRQDGDITNGFTQSIAANTQDVDVVFPRLYLMPTLVNNGLLMDMATVDFRDLEAPWWNSEANEKLNIYGKQFGMVSDITFQDKVSAAVTYFNQDLAKQYNLGNLYETVLNDEWTLDNLLVMGKDVSADLNNDGIYDENDAYPLSCQNDAVYYLLNGGNLHFCEKDAEGNIVLSLTGEQEITALQRIFEIMGTGTLFFNRQTYGVDLNGAINMFSENKAMFLIRPLQSLFLMRNMEADFGILPIPKLNEDQKEYGTPVNNYTATFMCFPKTTPDTERTASVTEMMALESHYTVIGPLYENILSSKLVREDNASRMLDIVFDSLVFDIGVIWNFGNMTTTILTNTGTDVASLLKRIEKPVTKQIQTLGDKVKNGN